MTSEHDEANATDAPLSAASLAGTAILAQRELAEALAALRRAAEAEERGRVAIYNETTDSYEARQRQLAAAVAGAALHARRLERQSWETISAIRKAVAGAGSLGLSAAEWAKAGELSRLAETMTANAPLERAVAALRSALGANDRPRAAAFLAASEARLRADPGDPGADELRALIAEARHELRDTTFDRVHAELHELQTARGDLGMALARTTGTRDAEQAVAAMMGGRPVAIPSEAKIKAMQFRHKHRIPA